jgi:S1-C subfamily serine protease
MEICRCGESRIEMLAPGALDDSNVPAPVASSGRLPWLVLGAVAIVAAGGLIAIQVVPVRPNPKVIAPESPASTSAPSSPIATAFAQGATADKTADSPIAPLAPIVPLAPNAPIVPNAPSAIALEDVVSRSIPAIVSIEAGDGRGSGFFAAPRTVITNRHVVQGNVSVTVRMSTGQTLPGRVETTSQEYDLAVVRVDSALPTQPLLPLGTVNDVRPGQEVIAIGLALGVFQNSVTRGIISAVRRADRTVMLQTDAAINPGNSGGPLLDRNGQVVGINTMKVTGVAESLGFAVAADHARSLLNGERPTGAASSAQVGQAHAPAFSARSSTDAAREEGTRRYGQFVEAVARRASQLDSYWERIKTNCAVRVAAGYDREWFGLWDGRVVLTDSDASCGSAIKELETLTAEVRVAMGRAHEDARRAAVLPGQLREIRRRYRMDWAGFDR